jgi:hypothetical protein
MLTPPTYPNQSQMSLEYSVKALQTGLTHCYARNPAVSRHSAAVPHGGAAADLFT